MEFRTALAVAVAGFGLMSAGHAFAGPIHGTSSGTFSKLSGCDSSGSDRECGILDTDQGASTQLRWPYLQDNRLVSHASSLTAVDIAIDTAVSVSDLVIARLDWFNAATSSSLTPDSLAATWTLTIAFSSPDVAIDSEAFKLKIVNTDNPSDDRVGGFALRNLSHLRFDLTGWTVDDFRYTVVDGAGSCSGIDTALTGSTWYNCEENMASLLITADFTAHGNALDGNEVREIHEPATVALLAAGLLGLAAVTRRRPARVPSRRNGNGGR